MRLKCSVMKRWHKASTVNLIGFRFAQFKPYANFAASLRFSNLYNG